MSSSGDSDKITIRFADYVETHHHNLLNLIEGYRKTFIDESPYTEYNDLEINNAFFSIGYLLVDFPSIYDMFGKFMAGLDIDSLYEEIFGEVLAESEINPYLQSEAALLDMDITSKTLPAFLSNMRSLNTVISSSFVIGKAAIETMRIKALAKISNNLKYRLIPLITDRWKTSLDFRKNVVTLHAFNLKFYFMSKMAIDETNYKKESENSLWPFRILEYERIALQTLSPGTKVVKEETAERSNLSKGLLVCSYTATGAALGSYFPPYGTIIGAVIGFVVGVAIVLLE